MELLIVCAVLAIPTALLAGVILLALVFSRLQEVKRSLAAQRRALLALQRRVDALQLPPGPEAETETGPAPSAAVQAGSGAPPPSTQEERPAPASQAAAPAPPDGKREPAAQPAREPEERRDRQRAGAWIAAWARSARERLAPGPEGSFEFALGSRWLVWIGMALVLIGTAFFLKHAYDMGWIGPLGRLYAGVAGGCASLAVAELCRRKGWRALFQALSGGGLGIFYLCIYFASFQVYDFIPQEAAFALASLVTLAAIAFAVYHDAMAIAVLALIGGFASPVALGSGENRPWTLLSYVAVLDATAMGVAYFRRWRGLPLLCFAGTALVYNAWFHTMGADAPPAFGLHPALVFTSIYFLIFLIVPALYSLARKQPLLPENLALLIANSIHALIAYHFALEDFGAAALSWPVLGEAAALLALGFLYVWRVPGDRKGSESLFVLAAGLAALWVPLRLSIWWIPVAWAAEGAAVAYVSTRYRRRALQVTSALALLAACGQLLRRLPFRAAEYDSLWNAAFGAWLAVALLLAAAAYGYARRKDAAAVWLAGGASVLGYAVFTAAVSMEVHLAWALQKLTERWTGAGQAASQPALWALYAAATAAVLWRLKRDRWLPLAWSALGVSSFFLVAGFLNYDAPGGVVALNIAFLPRLALPLAAYGLAAAAWRRGQRATTDALTLTGHAAMASLLLAEPIRWAAAWQPVELAEGLAGGLALWAGLGLAAAFLAIRLDRVAHRAAAGVLFGLTGLGLLISAPLLTSGTHPHWLALNSVFLLRAAACAAAFAAARAFSRRGASALPAWLHTGAHAVTAVILAAEFARWQGETAWLAGFDAWRLTAAAWGLQGWLACRQGLKAARANGIALGAALCFGALAMSAGFLPHTGGETGLGAALPAVNTAFLPVAGAIAAVFASSYALRNRPCDWAGKALTVAGNAVLAAAAASEMLRWSHEADYLSQRMALGSVSALWALQAFAVIWAGLARRNRPQRVLGFVLFGLVLAKISLYDLATLEAVYRIVSFIASGALAILAGYVYQRSAAAFLQAPED